MTASSTISCCVFPWFLLLSQQLKRCLGRSLQPVGDAIEAFPEFPARGRALSCTSPAPRIALRSTNPQQSSTALFHRALNGSQVFARPSSKHWGHLFNLLGRFGAGLLGLVHSPQLLRELRVEVLWLSQGVYKKGHGHCRCRTGNITLVGGLVAIHCYFPRNIGNFIIPNWRSHIFSEGWPKPPNQIPSLDVTMEPILFGKQNVGLETTTSPNAPGEFHALWGCKSWLIPCRVQSHYHSIRCHEK